MPVMHCPNACFHNGECLGAVCHCYRGWTGVDCSHFHCPDLHDCSERGECVGPNVCKCYPGFLVGLHSIVSINVHAGTHNCKIATSSDIIL